VAELEVRLNAGEAVSLLVEICGWEESETDSSDEEFEGGRARNGKSKRVNMRTLVDKLRELSVQSHKYQAKKDRRTQRHSFRDFLHAVEVHFKTFPILVVIVSDEERGSHSPHLNLQDGEGPDQVIKFGNGEVLDLDSWVKKRQYDAMCQVKIESPNPHRSLFVAFNKCNIFNFEFLVLVDPWLRHESSLAGEHLSAANPGAWFSSPNFCHGSPNRKAGQDGTSVSQSCKLQG